MIIGSSLVSRWHFQNPTMKSTGMDDPNIPLDIIWNPMYASYVWNPMYAHICYIMIILKQNQMS